MGKCTVCNVEAGRFWTICANHWDAEECIRYIRDEWEPVMLSEEVHNELKNIKEFA